MTKTEDTRHEEHRVLAAEFTALTAVTPAAGQSGSQAFAAALWSFTFTDAQ